MVEICFDKVHNYINMKWKKNLYSEVAKQYYVLFPNHIVAWMLAGNS